MSDQTTDWQPMETAPTDGRWIEGLSPVGRAMPMRCRALRAADPLSAAVGDALFGSGPMWWAIYPSDGKIGSFLPQGWRPLPEGWQPPDDTPHV
ncbi:hypothetical protein [Falsiroseomonas sp. CW058]|uniref:hypothetical protein n=1 Tax=Falsiroseomonas sp. CW058 TaxID=3388664 RepID=UPI003D316856